MIKIAFAEPMDVEWQEWRQECTAAREVLVERVARGEKPRATELYKDARMARIYKSDGAPFYGKCAYCECDIRVNHPGDIEHFRPKNGVTEENRQPVQVLAADGSATPHPGYYWLAYEWRNLLFACEDCNRPSTGKTAGRRIGKWDQFPVREFRAVRPGEEEAEEPLLINPVEEDPADHLEVDDSGVIIAKTDRGQACINIFGLNVREALVNARRKCIKDTNNELVVTLLALLTSSMNDEEQPREHLAWFEMIRSGTAAYSAAGRVALRQGKEHLARLARFADNL